jgi:hypothetical protein
MDAVPEELNVADAQLQIQENCTPTCSLETAYTAERVWRLPPTPVQEPKRATMTVAQPRHIRLHPEESVVPLENKDENSGLRGIDVQYWSDVLSKQGMMPMRMR